MAKFWKKKLVIDVFRISTFYIFSYYNIIVYKGGQEGPRSDNLTLHIGKIQKSDILFVRIQIRLFVDC